MNNSLIMSNALVEVDQRKQGDGEFRQLVVGVRDIDKHQIIKTTHS